MEFQTSALRSTIQPDEMAGRVGGAVEESISIATQTSVAINIETRDAAEVVPAEGQHVRIREHPCVGRYQIEDTSGAWYWCGAFALSISTWRLGRELKPRQFAWIWDNRPEIAAFNRRQGLTNRANFLIEQLAVVLHVWGRLEGLDHLNLQLGVIIEGNEHVYIYDGDEEVVLPVSSAEDMDRLRGSMIVWIHHDNAQHLHGESMNHYSGITLLGPSEERQEVLRAESAIKEGSVTEMGEHEEMGQRTETEDPEAGPSVPSEQESSTEKGSETEMLDNAEMEQEAEEGKLTEDLKGDGSCDLAKWYESHWRYFQESHGAVWTIEDGRTVVRFFDED